MQNATARCKIATLQIATFDICNLQFAFCDSLLMAFPHRDTCKRIGRSRGSPSHTSASPPRSDPPPPRWRSWPARPARRRTPGVRSSCVPFRSAAANSPTSSISHMNVPSMPRAMSFSRYMRRINCWNSASVISGRAAAGAGRLGAIGVGHGGWLRAVVQNTSTYPRRNIERHKIRRIASGCRDLFTLSQLAAFHQPAHPPLTATSATAVPCPWLPPCQVAFSR